MSLSHSLLVPGLGLPGGRKYLLRDEFTDTRAAGAVNGTPAVPGPGNRVDADAGNKISISSGALQIAAAAAFAATHRYDVSIARVVGQLMVWEANNSGTAILVGLSNSSTLSDANSKYAMQVNAGNALFFRESAGASASQLATVSGSTKYAIGLRATGAWGYALISGVWRLIYISGVNSQTPLWPYAGQISTTGVGVIPYMRVPQTLYIPPLLAYDTFTRANGAIGSTEAAGPDGQVVTVLPWTGATWTIVTNAAINTPNLGADVVVNGAFAADTDWSKGALWSIAAGVATAAAASSDITASVAPLTVGIWYQVTYDVPSVTAGTLALITGTNVSTTTSSSGSKTKIARAIATGALGFRAAGATLTLDNVVAKPLTLSELFSSINVVSAADVHARAAITLDGSGATKPTGIVLNLDSAASPANFILAYLDGNGNAILDECVAGVYTNKISAAVTYSAGAYLYVIRRGTSAWMFYNGVQVGTVQTMTANVGTLFGLFSTSPLCSLDNFEVWPDGGNGEHDRLGLM